MIHQLKDRLRLRLKRSERWRKVTRWGRKTGVIPRWTYEEPGMYRWVILARRSPRLCRGLYRLRERLDWILYDRASTDAVLRAGAVIAIVERFGLGDHLAAIATNGNVVGVYEAIFSSEQWREILYQQGVASEFLEAQAGLRRTDAALPPDPRTER